MPILTLTREYMVWHYSTAFVDLVHVWWNYLWFINHIFAFPDVVMSWFSPFKRLQEDKVNILLRPSDFFANLVVNIIMRIVGAVIRTAIIAIALIGFAVVFSIGLFFLLIWTILPLLVIHFFFIGFRSFIQ